MEEEFMIIGAKKKNEIKISDKLDQNKCIEAFNKYYCKEIIKNEEIIELINNGELEKSLIRPIAWRIFLNGGKIELKAMISIIIKKRNEFKQKLKNLNSLKKFSGDPLNGINSNDVKNTIINLVRMGIFF